MRKSRRIATIGLSVAVAGALIGGPASAQDAQVEAGGWGGTASADALTISLFGQTITTSAATAEVNSSPLARASATQVLTPAFSNEVTAETTTVPDTQESVPESCTGSELTQLPGVVRSDITCGSAVASLVQDGGAARGLGAEVVLEPSVSEVLQTLQLQEPVRDGVNQLFQDAIAPIVEGLTGNPIGDLVDDTVTTVQDVLNDVLTLQSTARIVIAPALAEVEATADTVTSRARAQGVRIELLPVDGAGATNNLLPDDLEVGEPLITITIGDAFAQKVVNRSSGAGEGEARASAVTVRIGSAALLDTLGLSQQEITLEVDQSICLLEGTPLETCVNVASASVDADGNAFADGTSVQALRGVNGGIDLAVGRAAVGGESPAAPAEAPQPVPAGELPRTGGPAALPLIGAGLLALAAGARRLAFGRRG